jgi:hypothetical protein
MSEESASKSKGFESKRLLPYGFMLVALCLALSITVRLPQFKSWLSEFIEGQLEASLGESVELGALEISILPLRLQVDSVRVGDIDAPTILVDSVSVNFDFFGLGGIDTLHLEEPRVGLQLVQGQLVQLPGLAWNAGTVGHLPWDTLSIQNGAISVASEASSVTLAGLNLSPTGHGVGDAEIGELVVRHGDWVQKAADVRIREFALSKERIGANAMLLKTEMGRIEGGMSVSGPEHTWSGAVRVAVDLAELATLLPDAMDLSGILESDLELSGAGESFLAKGSVHSNLVLEQKKIRARHTELREFEGSLSLNKQGLSLVDGRGSWCGGTLEVTLSTDYSGENTRVRLAGSKVSLEEILRLESGFPTPWVGMGADYFLELGGSLIPLDLSGDFKVNGENLVVVNKGLYSANRPVLTLANGEVSGELQVDATGYRVQSDAVHLPGTHGSLSLFLARGPFPELDLYLDLERLDFGLIRPFGGLEMAGKGSLKGRLWGNLGRPLQVEASAIADQFQALGVDWADRLETRISSTDLKRIRLQPLLARKAESRIQGSMVLDFQPAGLDLAVDLLVSEARVEDLLDMVGNAKGVTGLAEGSISLQGPPAELAGEIELELGQVDLFGEVFDEGRLTARMIEGRIFLDPLRLSRNDHQESLWFRGAIDPADWSIKGDFNADRIRPHSRPFGTWIAGEVYADIGLTGPLKSPIPKGRIALRQGRLGQEPVGVSLFEFERQADELIWTGTLFEEALSVRARQQIGKDWRYSLEGGWRAFPVHALHPYGADGRSIRALLDGGFVFQGNWREGLSSLHGRATAERFSFNWGEYTLQNPRPWTVDVMGGSGEASDLQLSGSGMSFTGGLEWDGLGLKAEAAGKAFLGLLPLVSPGIEVAEGPVELSLRVDTAGEAPHVWLEAKTSGADLRTQWFPHTLEGFNARLLATEQGYSLSDLSGTLGGGRVTAEGTIAAEGGWPRRFDMQAQLSKGRIRYFGFLPTLEGDARMALAGPVDNLELSGEVQLKDVRFSERVDWEQWMLDLRESKLAERLEDADSDPLFSMNLTVKGTGAARIRNNLAHGNADVDLQILGDTERPGILGTVRMLPGGRMTIQDREFEVARAELHYVDPWSFDPELDILLNTDIRSRDELYRIEMQVGGPFSDWFTVASSQPTLSQSDINALLLFGLTREELERFGGVNAALLLEGADIFLHGVGFDNRALERLGGGSLPFDRVELVTGVSERGNQVSSETRVLLEKQLSDPYNVDLRLEFNPFRNAENYLELEKQVGDSTFLTLYRSSLEQERSVKIGGAYGLDFKVRWEVE